MPLCHYGPMDPLFMRYDYSGIQRASYLLSVANGTDKTSKVTNKMFIYRISIDCKF